MYFRIFPTTDETTFMTTEQDLTTTESNEFSEKFYPVKLGCRSERVPCNESDKSLKWRSTTTEGNELFTEVLPTLEDVNDDTTTSTMNPPRPPDFSGFAPMPLRPFFHLFMDGNSTDLWRNLKKRSIIDHYDSGNNFEDIHYFDKIDANLEDDMDIDEKEEHRRDSSDYDLNTEDILTTTDTKNISTTVESVTEMSTMLSEDFENTEVSFTTTVNDTYNTDEYPNYDNVGLSTNQQDRDCFIIIEVCDG